MEMEKKYCWVSVLVTNEKLPICWMFRDQPDESSDSGWRFFSGTEEENFFENEDNLEEFTIAELLELDPSVAQYLKENPGVEYERDDAEGAWVLVKGLDS